MMCRKPFMVRSVPFGCGQCLPCRINRRRKWAWRQFFESLCHDENCFVTLTYSPEKLPEGNSLDGRHLQLFLKALRNRIAPSKVRFFAVGEYGDQTQRPHYHLSLFGIGQSVEPLIAGAWSRGFVQVAEFNDYTAQYVAGYVVKKMTRPDDERLEGRLPEFARMSLNPGIGFGAMSVIAEAIKDCADDWFLNPDVPNMVKIGGKDVPLDRYLISKLRIAAGITVLQEREIRKWSVYEKSREVLQVFKDAQDVSGTSTIRSAFVKSIEGRLDRVEARSKLRKGRSL